MQFFRSADCPQSAARGKPETRRNKPHPSRSGGAAASWDNSRSGRRRTLPNQKQAGHLPASQIELNIATGWTAKSLSVLCQASSHTMKRLLIVCLIVVGIVVAVAACRVLDESIRIPPRSLTNTTMWVLKRRILQFAHSHGELPHTLTALPEMQGYDTSTRDEWGRDIVFEVSTSGIVTLRSLGRDGVVGGSGNDADMIGSFPSRDADGRWNDEMVQWSHNPFSPQ